MRTFLMRAARVTCLGFVSMMQFQCTDQANDPPPVEPIVESVFAINGNGVVTLGWTGWIEGLPAEVHVHKGSSSGFTPTSATFLTVVSPETDRFEDTEVTNGIKYYYRLVPVEFGDTGEKFQGTPSNTAIGSPSDYDAIGQIFYDEHIQTIFSSSCAVNDCHVGALGTTPDGQSLPKVAHGGQFSLLSWEDLMYSEKDGAVVVPFKSSKSDLVFHVNSDTTIAPVASLHMPLPGFNIPSAQVTTLMRWIDEGARNNASEVSFPVSPLGRVVTVCGSEDLLAVVDVETDFLVRYVEVGKAADPGTLFGSPHHVKLDPRGEFFFVTLINSQEVWKISATTYEHVGTVSIPSQPADLAFSPTGDTIYVTSFSSLTGLITLVDARTMTAIEPILVTFASNPHGIVVSHDGSRAFVTNSGSGNITQINLTDNSTTLIALDTLGNPFSSDVSPYLPALTPDDRYLFATDYASGGENLYVIDLLVDPTKPSHVVNIGGRSIHVAVTPDGNSAFVCNLGTNSINVISIPDFTVRTIPNVGKQPHGVIFTSDGLRAYVTTENLLDPDPPHHPTNSNDGVSYVYVIDVPSLSIIGSIEVGAWGQGITFLP